VFQLLAPTMSGVLNCGWVGVLGRRDIFHLLRGAVKGARKSRSSG
jgi:hypothetical protein